MTEVGGFRVDKILFYNDDNVFQGSEYLSVAARMNEHFYQIIIAFV